MRTTEERTTLAGVLRAHAGYCRAVSSPFYAELMEFMAAEVEAGSAIADLMAPDAADAELGYRLRVLGGLHRIVLAGDAPALAYHYPTTGGDGDAAAAWPHIRGLLEEPPPALLDALTRPPQTNEAGRSAALVCGFLVVARDTGLPLRVLELGSSAGLNLRFDRYRYEQDGASFGDPGSPVRFENLWRGGRGPFDADCRVAERRGCDRNPIDATTEDGRLTLLSYVWPGQVARFELLAAALEVAGAHPVPVDRADIPDWLGEQLNDAAPGVATVVFHSVVWSYLTADEQGWVGSTLRAAGERATPEAPLAWLRLEGAPTMDHTELRLTTWPGGEEQFLARASYHIGPVTWLV
ncbi:MAG TPA: DUF2332 domain-containing protein [Acidimicrobiia bacterium]|nr:DUF2332 domain-containing protein [Acidimicrobiia bacterium]